MIIVYSDLTGVDATDKFLIGRIHNARFAVTETAYSLQSAQRAQLVLNDHEVRNNRIPEYVIIDKDTQEVL